MVPFADEKIICLWQRKFVLNNVCYFCMRSIGVMGCTVNLAYLICLGGAVEFTRLVLAFILLCEALVVHPVT